MEPTILNIDELQSIEVLEFYINRYIGGINSIHAFNLGKDFTYAFNLLKMYFYDPSSLSAIELIKIPNFLKLFELCGISEEILRMSKEDLLDELNIQYYKIQDNTQVINNDRI